MVRVLLKVLLTPEKENVMKTLYIVLLAAVVAGAIALVACSDAVSTDGEVNPLANDEDMVCGYVYDSGNPPQPIEDAVVGVYKRESATSSWYFIEGTDTNEDGYYDFHLDPWPAGWLGKVDATFDEQTADKKFTYPEVGPVDVETLYL
jgi:hypothetical protein